MNELDMDSIPPHGNEPELPVTVYTPDSGLRSPVALLKAFIADVRSEKFVDLTWRLVVRNVSATYRQSVLGVLWLFVPPLVTAAVWIVLNSQRVISVGKTAVPYPLYVLAGNLVWQGFARSISAPTEAVGREKAILTKLNFPREALLAAGFVELYVNAFVPMLLLVPMLPYFHVPMSWALLAAPVALAFTLLVGFSFGLLLTPAGLLFHDVGRGIPVLTRFWFFATPVIYPMPTTGLMAKLIPWNPAASLIMTTRDLFTGQSPALLPQFGLVVGLALLLLAFGLLVYRLAMPHIVERMSA
jgi:lipopolysaccharide transport system permease protein